MADRPLVLYHGLCTDGFCAAWVAHRAFGDGADYLPVLYAQEPPDVEGRDLYMLDFSYKRATMLSILASANSLVLLDHHQTAEQELAGLDRLAAVTVVFDMTRSGAGLAWDYFNPGKTRPWLVNYVEDADLHRWALLYTRQVHAVVASMPFDFQVWHALATKQPGMLVREGESLLRQRRQMVELLAAQAIPTVIGGHLVPAANAPLLAPDVAELLSRDSHFGVGWYRRADGKYTYSLRSRPGGLDVSVIAAAYGGGGHRHAAGFETTAVIDSRPPPAPARA